MKTVSDHVDIADFRVGQRVRVATNTARGDGWIIAIDLEHAFPGHVRLDSGETCRVLPWEMMTIPASRNIEHIEAWLDT